MAVTKIKYKCVGCGEKFKSFFPIEREWKCDTCYPIFQREITLTK